MILPEIPPPEARSDSRLALIADSFYRLTGKPLVESADLLWNAPKVIVAHGTEVDPVFFYGNKLALQLFEMSFAEFTRLPSRLSAETMEQGARAALLERVTRAGFVDDYSGVRISKNGARFVIKQATVWNLLDEAGVYRGQAATFDEPLA
ncbi:MAG: MEKHLA domain-containing protein [Gallionella sp.]|jgi:hypothetical protein